MAVLRLAAGRYADDERLTELVGELSVKSEDFAAMWPAGDVLACGSGTKRFRHPVIGELTLRYETLQLPASAAQAGQELHVYSAGDDGARDGLRLLAGWTAPSREGLSRSGVSLLAGVPLPRGLAGDPEGLADPGPGDAAPPELPHP